MRAEWYHFKDGRWIYCGPGFCAEPIHRLIDPPGEPPLEEAPHA